MSKRIKRRARRERERAERREAIRETLFVEHLVERLPDQPTFELDELAEVWSCSREEARNLACYLEWIGVLNAAPPLEPSEESEAA